jgi:hypothetical protein
MKATLLFVAALCHHQLVAADWQFRPRPDLAPPRLNNTVPAADAVEKGYLFVSPFEGYRDVWRHGPRQPGPYIFRDNGDLVWSGYSIYSIWASNFQAGRWKGEDVLFGFEGAHNPGYGHGHGHVTFLNQHYDTIHELRAGNHKISDKHEFRIVNEETGILQVYQPVRRDLSEFGGSPQQQWIVNAIFQGMSDSKAFLILVKIRTEESDEVCTELDIATGKLLFEWASLDHVSPYGELAKLYLNLTVQAV